MTLNLKDSKSNKSILDYNYSFYAHLINKEDNYNVNLYEIFFIVVQTFIYKFRNKNLSNFLIHSLPYFETLLYFNIFFIVNFPSFS